MKIILKILAAVFIFNCAYSQNVQFTTKKVGRQFEKNVYVKNRTVYSRETAWLFKDYEIKINSYNPKRLCVFFYSLGGSFSVNIFDLRVSAKEPFVYPNPNPRVDMRKQMRMYKAAWGYPSSEKIIKMDACLFVFDIDTEKLVCIKTINGNKFADTIERSFWSAMADIVHALKESEKLPEDISFIR